MDSPRKTSPLLRSVGLVSNLDFVESIFGNGGDPFIGENDAALDPFIGQVTPAASFSRRI